MNKTDEKLGKMAAKLATYSLDDSKVVMSKTEHTPGPWTKDEHGDSNGNFTIRPSDGSTNGDIHAEVIATVYTEEDAELISSAPDLLRERDELKRQLDETMELVIERNSTIGELKVRNEQLVENYSGKMNLAIRLVEEFVDGLEKNRPEMCKGMTYTRAKQLISNTAPAVNVDRLQSLNSELLGAFKISIKVVELLSKYDESAKPQQFIDELINYEQGLLGTAIHNRKEFPTTFLAKMNEKLIAKCEGRAKA